MTRPPVMVGIASIPERELSLRQVIAALAPQVDTMVVALNDYAEMPSWSVPSNVVLTRRFDGNLGDAEKFSAIEGWDGVVLTCDDDIGYPADYVEKIIAGLERWPGRAVSFHGGVTLGWNGAATAASHRRVRCLGSLDEDDPDVNVLGTGTLAWDNRAVPVWPAVFRHANCADVQFACHARRFGIGLACLRHRAGWLRDIGPPSGRRIYESNRAADGTACDTTAVRRALVEQHNWLEPPRRPLVRVSIATCARPGLLMELLRDIDRQHVDLEVAVYEDPTLEHYREARRFCHGRGWQWHTFSHRMGRERFWRIVDRQLRDCHDSDADYFAFLPDDIRLVPHALPKAIDLWHRLDQPATLTLWRMKGWEGQSSWTGRRPVDRGAAWESYHVDGNFLCQRPTLQALEFKCVGPRRLNGSSSGVGKSLSIRLHHKRLRMYRVPSSLTTMNDGGVSIMNPDEPATRPFYGVTL